MDLTKLGVGAVIGVVLAFVSLVVFGPDREGTASPIDDSVETTAAPDTTVAPWVAPGEVQFESTILIPTEITVEDGVVALGYDLATLAPQGDRAIDDDPIVDALPERWALTTISGGGTIVTTDPSAHAVEFDVRTGLLAEHIADVRLIGWRVAVPNREVITVDLVAGSTAEFAGGTDVTVATILDQSNSTIVQVDVDEPHDEWAHIHIDAVDPRWRVSGRLDGGLQFIWEGSDAPASISLEQMSPNWIPVEGDLVVFAGEDR